MMDDLNDVPCGQTAVFYFDRLDHHREQLAAIEAKEAAFAAKLQASIAELRWRRDNPEQGCELPPEMREEAERIAAGWEEPPVRM